MIAPNFPSTWTPKEIMEAERREQEREEVERSADTPAGTPEDAQAK